MLRVHEGVEALLAVGAEAVRARAGAPSAGLAAQRDEARHRRLQVGHIGDKLVEDRLAPDELRGEPLAGREVLVGGPGAPALVQELRGRLRAVHAGEGRRVVGHEDGLRAPGVLGRPRRAEGGDGVGEARLLGLAQAGAQDEVVVAVAEAAAGHGGGQRLPDHGRERQHLLVVEVQAVLHDDRVLRCEPEGFPGQTGVHEEGVAAVDAVLLGVGLVAVPGRGPVVDPRERVADQGVDVDVVGVVAPQGHVPVL
mmetsp:Transcript_101966/g.318679  ORF Transcript_101966/g.318679 Transcript_101966/m.318679 type:complete len:253 (-) Transcript_101966:17-775(-)